MMVMMVMLMVMMFRRPEARPTHDIN